MINDLSEYLEMGWEYHHTEGEFCDWIVKYIDGGYVFRAIYRLF